jgi:hypothetical protein
MGEIVAELLKFGGIDCKEDLPKLNLWQTIEGKTQKIELSSLDEFMRMFGPGTYQILVSKPEVDGIETEEFSITNFIVEITLTVPGRWERPQVHTEEEEIWPSHMRNGEIDLEKMAIRSRKLGEKIEGAMTILSLFCDVVKQVADA